MAGAQEAGTDFRRVQRPTVDLPVVHLEREVPALDRWSLSVDGLVEEPCAWDIEQIRSFPREERTLDLNCVWGWVRPACRWRGVEAWRLLDAARPKAGANFVLAEAAADDSVSDSGRVYASCLSMGEARASLVAWQLDEADLTPEHGAPLRLVPPPEKWGYKGVKWLARLSVIDSFSPGFWEEMVGNPVGDIPSDLLEHRFE